MARIAVLGIDLGKNSCSVVGLDGRGAVIKRRRMRPGSIPVFTQDLAPCVVAMEACCGAHHLGRLLQAQGHQVRLMSPEYVRPCVKAQKSDDRDAEAIAEAATSAPTQGRSRWAHHALCGAEERGAARHADAAPCPRAAGWRAHGADQPAPRHPA